MNFLALCKRVHFHLRVGEEQPGSQPTTVVNQKGVLSEIVTMVNGAYDDILRLHPDWKFLRVSQGNLTLPEGAGSLALSAIRVMIPAWDHATPFVGQDYGFLLIQPPQGSSDVSNSEQEVRYIPIQDWYGHFDVAPLSTGQPSFFTVSETGALVFDTLADREYTIRIPYRKTFVDMVADADIPIIPEAHHQTIVWWAIARYYCVSRDKTEELKKKSERELTRELTNLRNAQLPAFTLG